MCFDSALKARQKKKKNRENTSTNKEHCFPTRSALDLGSVIVYGCVRVAGAFAHEIGPMMLVRSFYPRPLKLSTLPYKTFPKGPRTQIIGTSKKIDSAKEPE